MSYALFPPPPFSSSSFFFSFLLLQRGQLGLLLRLSSVALLGGVTHGPLAEHGGGRPGAVGEALGRAAPLAAAGIVIVVVRLRSHLVGLRSAAVPLRVGQVGAGEGGRGVAPGIILRVRLVLARVLAYSELLKLLKLPFCTLKGAQVHKVQNLGDRKCPAKCFQAQFRP